jgi:Ca2+-binding EF-hand superfamily protein
VAAFSTLDQNNDGLVTKSDFKSKFSNLSDAKIELIFDRYNKKKNECLNFVEFKNFMNRRVDHRVLKKNITHLGTSCLKRETSRFGASYFGKFPDSS